MKSKQVLVIILFAFAGWLLCGMTIAAGFALTSMQKTLIIHAIAAPIFFIFITLIYQNKFGYTKPLTTAILFLSFVIVMDAGIVAPVFQRSYNMFLNPIGTWIPFGLIFLATYFTGLLSSKVKL